MIPHAFHRIAAFGKAAGLHGEVLKIGRIDLARIVLAQLLLKPVRHRILAIIEALGPSGYPGAEAWFSLWYSGLEPVPGVSTHAAAPASLIAETLLGELMLSSWEPLAQAATQIRERRAL